MRQNIWIRKGVVSQAKRLLDYKWLSEFISDMLEKYTEDWMKEKRKKLEKD